MTSPTGHDTSLASRILLSLALAMVFLLGLRTISSSDLWMHMAAGRHALEHGPASNDPFSFSLPVKTAWLQTTWLYDVVVHLMWQVGGSGLVTIFHTAAVVLSFLLLIPVARVYGSTIQVAVALFLCGWLMAPLFTPRPELLSMFFIAALVRLATRPVLGRFQLIQMALLQVIWVNSAPWFLLGPFILVFRALELRRPAGAPAASPLAATPRTCAVGALILLAACAANPFGLKPLFQSLHTITSLEPAVTLEWISPFARDFLAYPLSFLPTITLVLIAVVFILHREKLPLVLTFLAVVATFQIVQSNHHLEVNAVSVFPFLVLSTACIARLAARTRLLITMAWLRGLPAVLLALALFLSIGSIITNRYYIASGSASAFGWGVNTDAFPVAAAANLESLGSKPSRMINLSHDGGYLLWKFPGIKVFTDPRGALYGTAFYDQLSRGLTGHEESWRQIIERYDPDALLIHGTWTGAGITTFRLLQGEQWAMGYFDGTSILLVRTVSTNEKFLNDTQGRQRGLELIEKSRERYAGFLDNRFVRAPNPSRLIGAAQIYQSISRFEAALPLHTLLTEGSPRYVAAWINRGVAELQAALADRAIVSFEQVTRLIPENPISWLWLGMAYEAVERPADAQACFDKARAINRLFAERFLSEGGKPGATQR